MEQSFEDIVTAKVKEIREYLASRDDGEILNHFVFRIEASGRVHDGHVKIEFSMADYDYPSVRGNNVKMVLSEYVRRHGWNHENAPLMISKV